MMGAPSTASRAEAARCDELAELLGYTVVRLEQRRASKIHIGTPDRRYQGERGCFFFELKHGSDRLSREQHAFLRRELEGGSLATCGGLPELQALLCALQRTSLVHARNVCGGQLDAWARKGFRSERAPAKGAA